MSTSSALGIVLCRNYPICFSSQSCKHYYHWSCSVTNSVGLQRSHLLTLCSAVYAFLPIEPKLPPILWANAELVEFLFAKPVLQKHMKTAFVCSTQGCTFRILPLFLIPPSPALSPKHDSLYLLHSESVCRLLNAAHKGSRRTKTSCEREGQSQSLGNGEKIMTFRHQHLELHG